MKKLNIVSSFKLLSGRLLSAMLLSLLIMSNGFATDPPKTTEKDIETAKKIVRTAINDRFGYELLREFSAMGPRANGSENARRSLEWVVRKMKELGLDNVTKQPVMVPKWERGNVELAKIVKSKVFQGKPLNIVALGGSIGTPDGPITAKILEVKTFEELEKLGSKAKGKIIFFNRPMNREEFETFSAYGGAVNQRGGGSDAASRVGGVAAIVRSMTLIQDNTPHTGYMGYSGETKKVPGVAIGIQDADLLTEALKLDPDLEVSIELSAKNFEDAPSFNIYGQITGSEFPNEIVVVGGHSDTWDKGDGSHDDGGGCMQSIDVLYLLNKLGIKPKRTIRAVLFMNEETGGKGADKYAEFAATSGEIHVGAIESDRGVFTPRGFTVDSNDKNLSLLQSWIPVLSQAKIDWVKKGGSGADVGKITNAYARIGFYPDDSRYFDYHHSANDVFSAVHPREMEFGSAAMAILAYLISENGLDK